MYILWYILWCLVSLGDVGTTWVVLSRGGKEVAPVMAWLIHRMGTKQALIANLLFSILIGIPPSFNKRIIITLTIVRGLIALWNLHVIGRMK